MAEDNSAAESTFLFPVSQENVLPAIGQSFNVINGVASPICGFGTPPDADLTQLHRVNDKSEYRSIYDASSFPMPRILI